MSQWSEKISETLEENLSETVSSTRYLFTGVRIQINNFRKSSKKFIIDFLTKNVALNLSGAIFFVGLGYSLKWWYKDQLFIVLLKQNLPALSEYQQNMSWETGESIYASLNDGVSLPLNFVRGTGYQTQAPLIDRVDLYANHIRVEFKQPRQKHAYERFIGVFGEAAQTNVCKQMFTTKDWWKENSLLNSNYLQDKLKKNTGLYNRPPATPLVSHYLSPAATDSGGSSFTPSGYALGRSPVRVLVALPFPRSASMRQTLQRSTSMRERVPYALSAHIAERERVRGNAAVPFRGSEASKTLAATDSVGVKVAGFSRCAPNSISHVRGRGTGVINKFNNFTDYTLYTPERPIFPKKWFILSPRNPLFLNQGVVSPPFTENEKCRINGFSTPYEVQGQRSVENPSCYASPDSSEALGRSGYAWGGNGVGGGQRSVEDPTCYAPNSILHVKRVRYRMSEVANWKSLRSKVSVLAQRWRGTGVSVSRRDTGIVKQGGKESSTDKFSYPLQLTKKLVGWQPSSNVLLLNSYLDEIPYKLENTLTINDKKLYLQLLSKPQDFLNIFSSNAENNPIAAQAHIAERGGVMELGAGSEASKTPAAAQALQRILVAKRQTQRGMRERGKASTDTPLLRTRIIGQLQGEEAQIASAKRKRQKKLFYRNPLLFPYPQLSTGGKIKSRNLVAGQISASSTKQSETYLRELHLFETKKLLESRLASLINSVPISFVEKSEAIVKKDKLGDENTLLETNDGLVTSTHHLIDITKKVLAVAERRRDTQKGISNKVMQGWRVILPSDFGPVTPSYLSDSSDVSLAKGLDPLLLLNSLGFTFNNFSPLTNPPIYDKLGVVSSTPPLHRDPSTLPSYLPLPRILRAERQTQTPQRIPLWGNASMRERVQRILVAYPCRGMRQTLSRILAERGRGKATTTSTPNGAGNKACGASYSQGTLGSQQQNLRYFNFKNRNWVIFQQPTNGQFNFLLKKVANEINKPITTQSTHLMSFFLKGKIGLSYVYPSHALLLAEQYKSTQVAGRRTQKVRESEAARVLDASLLAQRWKAYATAGASVLALPQGGMRERGARFLDNSSMTVAEALEIKTLIDLIKTNRLINKTTSSNEALTKLVKKFTAISNVNKISFKQIGGKFETLDELDKYKINVADTRINFEKDLRYMSGYVYPDIQSNSLKAHLYEWLGKNKNLMLFNNQMMGFKETYHILDKACLSGRNSYRKGSTPTIFDSPYSKGVQLRYAYLPLSRILALPQRGMRGRVQRIPQGGKATSTRNGGEFDAYLPLWGTRNGGGFDAYPEGVKLLLVSTYASNLSGSEVNNLFALQSFASHLIETFIPNQLCKVKPLIRFAPLQGKETQLLQGMPEEPTHTPRGVSYSKRLWEESYANITGPMQWSGGGELLPYTPSGQRRVEDPYECNNVKFPYRRFNHYLAKFPGFSDPSQFFTTLPEISCGNENVVNKSQEKGEGGEEQRLAINPVSLRDTETPAATQAHIAERGGVRSKETPAATHATQALQRIGEGPERGEGIQRILAERGGVQRSATTTTSTETPLESVNLIDESEINKVFIQKNGYNPRKVAYSGIVVQRNKWTKDFQPGDAKKSLDGAIKSSIWGTLFLGPENPLTDRQCHFFGQKQLSTLDTNSLQRDYLRQLGREIVTQSNSKGYTELSKFSSIERTKILSLSKKVNSFFFKKRKYSYLLEPKDQWHLLFQEQLCTALEDCKKYPLSTIRSFEETNIEKLNPLASRIKVSAPLIMARFPKKLIQSRSVKQETPAANSLGRLKQEAAAADFGESYPPYSEGVQLRYAYLPLWGTRSKEGVKLLLVNPLGKGDTKLANYQLEQGISWRPFCHLQRSSILEPSSSNGLPPQRQKLVIVTHTNYDERIPHQLLSHYPPFTERSSEEWSASFNANKNSLFSSLLNGGPFIATQYGAVLNQWVFLIALLFWVEQTLINNVFPALFALEQSLLSAAGIKNNRTHVFRISKNETPKFQNLAGIDGLLGELSELVLFLRGQRNLGVASPVPFGFLKKWNKKNSYGVLLTGSPGTGKTFLVRALANEAKVPVLILSASALTTSKVNNNKPSWSIRHAFKRAKQLAPCILFIDEIDALGKSRGQIVTDINEIVAERDVDSLNAAHKKMLPLSHSSASPIGLAQQMFSYEQFGQNCSHFSATLLNKWEYPLHSTILQESNEINGSSLCQEKLIDLLKIAGVQDFNPKGVTLTSSSAKESATQDSSFKKEGTNETPYSRSARGVQRFTNSPNLGTSGELPTREKEMTRGKFGPLTQLLVSMDGVSSFSGVLIMGATNRPELLDPALTRPGRFEKIIRINKPSEQNRIEILQLYSQNLGVQQQIPWSYLATRTIGLTTADLAVAMNYSSLRAIIQGSVHTLETIEYGLNCISRL